MARAERTHDEMAYTLLPPSRQPNDKVVLKYSPVGLNAASIVFILMGFLMLFFAVVIFIAENEFTGAVSVFSGLGLVFIPIPFLSALNFRMPSRFVFDNVEGALLVEESGSKQDEKAAFMPYESIEGFFVQRHVHLKTGGSTKRSVSFRVGLAKKDGATWVFGSSKTRQGAEEMRDFLEEKVDLTRPTKVSADAQPSGFFQIDSTDSQTTISWKRPPQFGKSFIVALIGLGVGLVVFGAISAPGYGLYVAEAGVALFFILIIARLVGVGFRGKQLSVQIAPEKLTHKAHGGWGGDKGFSIPLKDVGAILLNFSFNSRETSILVPSPSQHQQAKELRLVGEEPSEDPEGQRWGERIRLWTGMKSIDVSGLLVAQQLELENLLRDRTPSYANPEPS